MAKKTVYYTGVSNKFEGVRRFMAANQCTPEQVEQVCGMWERAVNKWIAEQHASTGLPYTDNGRGQMITWHELGLVGFMPYCTVIPMNMLRLLGETLVQFVPTPEILYTNEFKNGTNMVVQYTPEQEAFLSVCQIVTSVYVNRRIDVMERRMQGYDGRTAYSVQAHQTASNTAGTNEQTRLFGESDRSDVVNKCMLTIFAPELCAVAMNIVQVPKCTIKWEAGTKTSTGITMYRKRNGDMSEKVNKVHKQGYWMTMIDVCTGIQYKHFFQATKEGISKIMQSIIDERAFSGDAMGKPVYDENGLQVGQVNIRNIRSYYSEYRFSGNVKSRIRNHWHMMFSRSQERLFTVWRHKQTRNVRMIKDRDGETQYHLLAKFPLYEILNSCTDLSQAEQAILETELATDVELREQLSHVNKCRRRVHRFKALCHDKELANRTGDFKYRQLCKQLYKKLVQMYGESDYASLDD